MRRKYFNINGEVRRLSLSEYCVLEQVNSNNLLSRQDIADILNISKRTVIRIYKTLCDLNLIEVSYDKQGIRSNTKVTLDKADSIEMEEIKHSNKKRGRLPSGLRFKVLKRDGFRCAYCGRTGVPLQVDHIKPVSKGGTNDIDNLVTSCSECNCGKSDIY